MFVMTGFFLYMIFIRVFIRSAFIVVTLPGHYISVTLKCLLFLIHTPTFKQYCDVTPHKYD